MKNSPMKLIKPTKKPMVVQKMRHPDTDVVRNTPLWQELADWFYGHNERDLVSNATILQKIKKLKMERDPSLDEENVEVFYPEYSGLIVKSRIYLEEKHQISLIAVKVPGDQYCAYKLTNDAEATYIGIRTGKEVMNAMNRFRRRIPMIKKEFVWASMRKVFGEAQEEIVKFRSLSDRFIEGYEVGKEEAAEKKPKQIESK